jgi:hypothetical protein
MYDTLRHYKAFINSGMNERQAQALVYALRDVAQEIRQARGNARKILPKSSGVSFFSNLFKH